jgi:hypothetical protein
VREISEKAYVSSNEITECDRILEALLQDRVSIRRDTIVERLETTRHREVHVEKAIFDFAAQRPKEARGRRRGKITFHPPLSAGSSIKGNEAEQPVGMG